MSFRGHFYRIVTGLAVLGAALPASAIVFSATQDADAVLGTGFANSNFGNSGWISENYSGAASVVAYIQFDVSSLTPGSVTNAKLRLFQEFNSQNGPVYEIFKVNGSWVENTITGANQPGYGSTVYGSMAITSGTQVWREWDVTSLVQEWANGTSTNFGMAIKKNPDVAAWPYFRSRTNTSGNTPELVVDVVPEPTTALFLLVGLPLLARRKRK